jgi:VWFA-related protein
MYEILESAGRDWGLVTTGVPGSSNIKPVIASAHAGGFRAQSKAIPCSAECSRRRAGAKLTGKLMRAVCLACASLLAVAVAHAQQQSDRRYAERVDVERVLVDARVLDPRGNAVAGLTADDFAVKIAGKPVGIESVMWVGGSNTVEVHEANNELPAIDRRDSDAAPGRLIIFLFQKDFERSRLPGLMRMLIEARTFLDNLGPLDRVAVLSFDSRLRAWLDFTNDAERVRHVLQHGILFETPDRVQTTSGPSLMNRLDEATVSKTYTMEKALRLIAEAVHDFPGSKSVVLVGHGFGRLGWTGVTMEHGYEEARDALVAARASVFTLDVTQADYHSLEAGLKLVSAHTGGLFSRTHLFPEQAMRRLAGALAGYYVLFLESPNVERGTHHVDVRLRRRQGTVLARSSYVRE